MDPAIVGVAEIIHCLHRDPARSGGYANGPTIIVLTTDGGARDMRAMAVRVAGIGVAFIGSTKPVTFVYGWSIRPVAPVLGLKRRVLPVHPRIDDCHGNPSAVDPQRIPG